MDEKSQYLPLNLQSRLDHLTQVSQLSISSHNKTIVNQANSSTKASSEDKDQLSSDSQKSQVPFAVQHHSISRVTELTAHLNNLLNYQKKIDKKISQQIKQTQKIIEAKKKENDMVEQIVALVTKKVEQGRKDIVILYQIVNKKKKQCKINQKQAISKGSKIDREKQSKRNSFRPLPKNNSQQKLMKSLRMTNKFSTSRINTSTLKKEQNNGQEKECEQMLGKTKSVSPYGLRAETKRWGEEKRVRKLKIKER